MFHPKMPVYLRDVFFTTEKVDGETRKVVNCDLLIAPFTAEHAEELEAGIREHVFKRGNAEPLEQLAEAKFSINVPLQELRIQLAKDQGEGVRIIDNVRVDSILRVRKDKETPTFEARFRVNFPYPTADNLLFLAQQQNEQIVISLYDKQLNMLDEQRPEGEAKAPKLKKEKAEKELAGTPA